MMKRLSQTISLLVLLVHVVSGPVHAREGDTRHYLPAGSVDADAVIQPPPAVGSAAFKEQLAIVLWLQRTRTPAQVEFVQKPLNLERFVPLFDVDLVGV